MDTGKDSSENIVARFFLFGAGLGLLLGICEAALLHFFPVVPWLMHPDVSHVIWFLAPLVDMYFAGLAGLVIGWPASMGKPPGPDRSILLAATILGLAGAHLGWLLQLLHVSVGNYRVSGRLWAPAICFALVFACGLIMARIFWTHTARIFTSSTRWPLRTLGKVLLAVTTLLALGVVASLAGRFGSLPATWAGSSEQRPNIILITLDTVRADHLSLYGYSRPTTPNLERLSSRGALFENAIAPSSWTLASHASMLTGLLPHQHGATWSVPLTTEARTLAEVLESMGYEAVGFTSNLHYGQSGWGMGQGFKLYGDDSLSLRHNFAATLVGNEIARPAFQRLIRDDRFDRRNAQEVNRDVFRWFRRRAPRPFFLFINYLDAHHPYWAPAPFDRRFGRLSDAAVRRMNGMRGVRVPSSLPPDEINSLITGYDNCLAYLDDQAGKLFAELGRAPEWSNTIVVITSDHGEAFGEHGPYGHEWNLHLETIRVPLIIFGPGIPRELRITHVVRIRELFATVLDLAAGGGFPFFQVSLRRFWTPGYEPTGFDDSAISELIPNTGDSESTAYVSLVTSQWHYIHDSRGNVELYPWPTDPKEKTDVSGLPEHHNTLQQLRRKLEESIRLSHRPWRGVESLLALDAPGYSFLREVAFGQPFHPASSDPRPRIGAAQAYFTPDTPVYRRPLPADEELINSLPYR